MPNFINLLDDMLTSIVPQFDNIFVVGDVNIDLTNADNNVNRCFEAYGLKQVISEPIRITKTSATLLDPIYIEKSKICLVSGTLNADLFSDHRFVYCVLKFECVNNPQKFITFRDIKNLDMHAFNNQLNNIHWLDIVTVTDIENKVRFLTNNITKLFDTHCPYKTIRVSKPRSPWLTENLKLIYNERNKALSRFKRLKTPESWNNYKQLRNFALRSTRNEKAAYLRHVSA